ncbi:MAG: ATP-binding protein, partial [Thermodesulfobacteriota bacterium]
MNAFQSIKGRLLIFGLCISLIPIAIITTIYYFSARSALKRQIMQDMTAVAESRKAHVLEFLEAKKAQARHFSSDGFIRDTLENIGETPVTALNRHLSENKMPLDTGIETIAILDRDGKVVASTDETWIGRDMSDQETFTQAIISEGSKEAFIGQQHDFPGKHAEGVPMAAPITSKKTGETIGVIMNIFNPTAMIDATGTASKEVRTVDFSTDGFIRDTLENIGETPVTALNRHLSENKMPLNPDVTAIAVADLGGDVVACTTGAMIGTNIFGEGGFPKNMDEIYSEPYIRLLHKEPLLGATEFDVSAPIIPRSGVEPLGFIINHYNMSTMNKISDNRAGMGNTGEVVLAQRSGDDIRFLTSLRYAPDLEHARSVPFDSRQAEPMRLALEGGSGTIIAPDYRGIDVVAAYQYIPLSNSGLVAKIDVSEAFAPLRTLGIVTMIVGLVSAAAVASMAIVVAISTSRPIGKLTDATRRFASGDLKSRVKIARKDEIGELANGFNEMAKQLEERVLEATRKSKQLEELLEKLKASQSQLVQAEKMGALGTLSAGIAHELNNPMMGILNFTQYCIKHTSKDEKIHSILKDIERETNRCAVIVKDLLTFARQQTESIEDVHEEDCTELLGLVFKLLGYQLGKEGVNVTTHYAEMVPKVSMKKNSIQQVLLNIMGNSIDAMKGREKKEIVVDVRRKAAFVQITISDNGCGIAAENLEHIFDPFFTTKPEGAGTGLGLSVCMSIMADHGGKITCESTPGKWTTFKILLPIKVPVKG